MQTDIDGLRRLLAAAAPGPWKNIIEDGGGTILAKYEKSALFDDYNTNLILAAVNALPAMLDEMENARAASEQHSRIMAMWVAAQKEIEAGRELRRKVGEMEPESGGAITVSERMGNVLADNFKAWTGLRDALVAEYDAAVK